MIESYPNLTEVVWVQEEPKNNGAWSFLLPYLVELVPAGVKLRYVGRPGSASPSEGSGSAHTAEQNRIIREALSDAAVATPAVPVAPSSNGNGVSAKNGTNGAGHAPQSAVSLPASTTPEPQK